MRFKSYYIFMPYKDEFNQQIYHKAWYQKNKDRLVKKARQNNNAYKIRNRLYVQDYKSSRACVDCGGKFHFVAMDFDHLNASLKTETIARLMNQSYSLKRIKREMDLCDLVCANCHRIRTWQRLQ